MKISSIAYVSICVFVATSFTVDLMMYSKIHTGMQSFFLAITASKYLLPLCAWLLISLVQKLITRSVQAGRAANTEK
jgi:hypothetical protein